MEYIRISAKTVDDALMEASIQFGTSSDNIEYEVVEKGSSGFLGFGSKPAVIMARKKEEVPEESFEEAAEEPVKKAEVYLHGSFAATGEGHGTDKAIIAGLLGMKPDDLRIPDSFTVAEENDMEFTIAKKEIRGAHPNTARVIMENGADKKMVMQAYSIGGGRIRVSMLDGIEVDFSGESNTLIVRNMDRPGCITEVSAALSREKINVATMQVFRHKRGGLAVMVVETDQSIPENVVTELKMKEDILEVISLNLEEGR